METNCKCVRFKKGYNQNVLYLLPTFSNLLFRRCSLGWYNILPLICSEDKFISHYVENAYKVYKRTRDVIYFDSHKGITVGSNDIKVYILLIHATNNIFS